MGDFLQWVALTTEFVGLFLIAVELYFPRAASRMNEVLTDAGPERIRSPGTRRDRIWVVIWIVAYSAVWIITAIIVSLYDPSLNLAVNVAFTVFSVLLFVFVAIFRKLVRLGVWLGRGNSVGGIGLVLALIGFSLQVSQLIAL